MPSVLIRCSRKVLGDELVIVDLTMSKEERRERVLMRHPGDHAMVDRMDVSQEFGKNLEFSLKII